MNEQFELCQVEPEAFRDAVEAVISRIVQGFPNATPGYNKWGQDAVGEWEELTVGPVTFRLDSYQQIDAWQAAIIIGGLHIMAVGGEDSCCISGVGIHITGGE